MNKNIYNFADIIKLAMKNASRVADAIDVDCAEVPPEPGIKYTASMPVKAIFNVKTEETVPVLDEDGEPKFVTGENGKKRMLKRVQKLEKPILASKVFFEDGSWTVVKNSGEDTIDLVTVKLPNGNTAITASDASKERALAYAVVKHAFGRVNPETKEVYGANLGRRFEKVLKASIDQRISNAGGKAVPEKTPEPARCAKKEKRGKCGCGNADKEMVKDLLKGALAELAKLVKSDKAGSEKGRKA